MNLVERLRGDPESLRTGLFSYLDRLRTANHIESLEARIAELEGALEFYGDEGTWKDMGGWSGGVTLAWADGGKIARQTLKGNEDA